MRNAAKCSTNEKCNKVFNAKCNNFLTEIFVGGNFAAIRDWSNEVYGRILSPTLSETDVCYAALFCAMLGNVVLLGYENL